MTIGPQLLIPLLLIPLAGGAVIIYVIRKRPGWKQPILWALAGMLCWELVRQVAWLIYR